MDEEISLTIVKKEKGKVIKNILKVCIILLFSLILYIATELLNGIDIHNIVIGKKWINIVIITGIVAGIYGITGSSKWSMIITSVITMVLAVVNYVLIDIRGTPITPSDFYSIGMATKMVSSVKISIPITIIPSIGLIVLWIILCWKFGFKEIEKSKKKIIRFISIICCIMIFVLFFATDLLKIEMIYNTREFYEKNGVCASFFTILKEMSFAEPNGYSVQAIEDELENNEIDTKKSSIVEVGKEKKPNIIVIMNESLADLRTVYDLNITEDNMSFIHSLKENTIKANVQSLAIGSKTANCEWEFLTGNSTRFLPSGAVAYEQYVTKETYSLVSLLNKQGYYTTAFHPYNAEGYNRNLIYPLMGFDECKFRGDLTEYNEIRYDYTDDLSTYKNIINLFENKDDNEKIFNFTVTMQNHTTYWDENFESTVFLADYEQNEYRDISQYLTSVKLSDEAFQYLIEYFENFDEPTIIMMFGDHQPGLSEIYPELFGETKEDEYDRNKYIVPMILWANYDIPEYEIEDISMNYLSTLLFDVAGLEKNEYMEYLEDLYEKYPVITPNVYKDRKGIFHIGSDSPEEFNLYEYIQYNNMFDDEKLSYLFE